MIVDNYAVVIIIGSVDVTVKVLKSLVELGTQSFTPNISTETHKNM